MNAFSEFLIGYVPWIWIALGILLVVAETAIPGMHFAFFGIAGLVTGIVLLTQYFGFSLQLLVFGLTSLVAIAVGRPFYNKRQATDAPTLNERGLEYVGRTARVEQAIIGGRGRVRLGDTVWLAEGPEMAAGTDVKVTGVNGTVLIVQRV